ncbi:MAG: hypothetical protein AB7T09_15530 [Planctomycetota bacterium]
MSPPLTWSTLGSVQARAELHRLFEREPAEAPRELDRDQADLIERVTLAGCLWERLTLAAHLGHEAAQEALRTAKPRLAEDLGLHSIPRGRWPAADAPIDLAQRGLVPHGGRRACVEAAVSAAELCAPRLERAGCTAALDALRSAQAWLATPGRRRAELAEVASEEALGCARALGAAPDHGPPTFFDLLWSEALGQRKREGRPAPAPGPVEPDQDREALAAGARACALAARLAALPIPGQHAEAGDPNHLQQLACGDAARAVGREAVDAAVRARLLARALGDADRAELLQDLRAARDAISASQDLQPGAKVPPVVRAAASAHERVARLRDEWFGEPLDAWLPRPYERELDNVAPRPLVTILLVAGLLSALVIHWASGWARLVPWVGGGELGVEVGIAWAFATYVIAWPLLCLLRWRYRLVHLDPVGLAIRLGSGSEVRLVDVRAWRAAGAGFLVEAEGRRWWQRCFDPIFVPAATPEDRALVERFLRGDVRELMRQARVAG